MSRPGPRTLGRLRRCLPVLALVAWAGSPVGAAAQVPLPEWLRPPVQAPGPAAGLSAADVASGSGLPAAQDAAPERRDPADLEAHWRGLYRTHRTLELSTAGALLITGGLGTVVALNRPTLLGDGRCARGDPIFGDYGCGDLSTVHGIGAVLATVLYTATAALELALPDVPGAPRAAWSERTTLYRILTWVHRVTMAVQPLLGLLARFPSVIGVTDPETHEDLSRTLRTVHLALGYTAVASFGITTAWDF